MKKLFIIMLLVLMPFMLSAEDFMIYDGESGETDLDQPNGGGYYEKWWGGDNANSFTDSTESPHSGAKCARWSCTEAWSGGSLMVDPGWLGINIEPMIGIEFWARGEKGGESVTFEFYDTKLDKPGKKDGFFAIIKLENIPNKWTKYTFSLFDLTNKSPGKRPLDKRIFEGFMISGSDGGTVVYFDDMKFPMGERKDKIYSPIKHNRIGYRPEDTKTIIINKKVDKFEVINAETKKAAFSGKTEFKTELDKDSGDMILYADFSDLKEPGTYYISIPGDIHSDEFKIADDVYRDIWIPQLKVFYIQRCGIPLEEKYVGKFTRKQCHKDDAKASFTVRLDGTQPKGTVDVSGGWHDAGDDNKYVHPLHTTLWYLVQAYMLFPKKFPDNQLNIPESGNGRSDLVDELVYELKWLLKMQVKNGKEKGLVYHKVGQKGYGGDDPNREYLDIKHYVYEPTSAATSTFVSTTAMMSYLLKKQSDRDSKKLAKKARKAARRAWDALMKITKKGKKQYPEGGFKNPPGWGGSADMGSNPDEEKKKIFKAACELYRLTRQKKFHKEIRNRVDEYIKIFKGRDEGWGQDEFIPFFVYCSLPEKDIDPEVVKKMKDTVRYYRKVINRYVEKNGYRVPFGDVGHFCWGSNSHLLKNGVIFYYLYLWDKKKEDLNTAKRTVDYVMGLNAVDKVMYTGWGKGTLMYHGIWNSSNPDEQPPGYMVGGVDWHDGNDWMSKYPQKCYRDTSDNWSVNEGAIYYQASSIFMTTIFVPEK